MIDQDAIQEVTRREVSPEHREVPVPAFPGGQELIGKDTGFIIGARANRELLRLDADTQFVTIAKTGGGKGRSVAITNLLMHPGSVFSIEIGGATLNETINFRRYVLGQKIYVFDPHGQTKEPCASFNILDTLDPASKSFFAEVGLIADSIMQDSKGKETTEPYFKIEPGDVLKSLIIYVKTASEDEVPLENRHLPYIAELLGKFGSPEWDSIMVRLASDTGPYSALLNKVGNYFAGVERNRNVDSIVSSASGWLSFARDPALVAMMRKSDFSLSDLRDKKVSVYFVMKDASIYKQYHAWLRLMIERAMYACPNKGDAGRNFRYEDRVLFMIDEFTQLGKLQCIEEGMQTARQKGITLWTIFQDIGRLKEVYGDNLANSFLGAAACIQAFAVSDEMTAEFISKRAGKNIVMIPSVSRSVGLSETEARTESVSLSNGESFALQHGSSAGVTENWSKSVNFSSMQSENNAYTNGGGWSYEGGSHSNWSSTRSSTSGSSRGWGTQKGGGTQKSTNDSETKTRQNQTTKQEGSTYTTGRTETITLQYTPQILPRLDVSDVYSLLNSDDAQILFITANGSRTIVEKRAYYDQIPMLNRRAIGPEMPKFPVPPAPLESPKLFDKAIVGDKVELSLPDSPVQAVSFDRIIISSLYNLEKTRATKQHIPEKVLPHPKVHGSTEDKSESEKIDTINLLGAHLEEVEKSSARVRRSIANKIRAVNTYAESVSKVQTRLINASDRLRDSQADLQSYAQYLNGYAQILKGDASDDADLQKATPDFERYTDYYYYLRNYVWQKLPEPSAPPIEGAAKYCALEGGAFDYSILDQTPILTSKNPTDPFGLPTAPPEFSPVLPLSPNVKAIVEKATTHVLGSNVDKDYSLKEIDQKLEELHGEMRPKKTPNALGKMQKFVSSLFTSPEISIEVQINSFSKARAGLVDKIYQDVIKEYHSYFQATNNVNVKIAGSEEQWNKYLHSLQTVAIQLEATARDNARVGALYRQDLGRLKDRRDVLEKTNRVLTGQRARHYTRIAGLEVWDRYKMQSSLLEANTKSTQEALPKPERQDPDWIEKAKWDAQKDKDLRM